MPEDTQSGLPGLKIRVVDIEADETRNFQVPSFVNYVNVWRVGAEVYVDMGIVTVEEFLKPGAEVTAAMYDRFIMSPTTLDDLVGRLTLPREELRSKGLIPDGTVETAKAS